MAVSGVIGALSSAGALTSNLSAAFKGLGEIASKVGGMIKDFIGNAIQWVKDKFEGFKEKWSAFTDTIS